MTPTVLINAGPWLPVPPVGYGGIETVLATLIPQLRRHGVRVILATVGHSDIEVDEQISVFGEPQFGRLTEPYNDVVGIAAAHMQRVTAELRRRSDIDLVHDHMEVFGPSALAGMASDHSPAVAISETTPNLLVLSGAEPAATPPPGGPRHRLQRAGVHR